MTRASHGKGPTVSVVVPCYNSAKFLGEALDSVVSQSFQDWEIIAVDDGSSDETQSELNRYSSEIRARMRVIVQENRGAAAARNAGVSSARGRYIAFLDSDDLWHKRKLQKQIEYLRRHTTVLGVSTPYRVFQTGPQELSRVRTFEWNSRELNDWIRLGKSAPALCSTLMIDKDFLNQIGGFDESLGSHAEDPDLAWRLFRSGNLASTIDCLTYIRKYPNQGHRKTREMARSLGLFHAKYMASHPIPFQQAARTLQVYLSFRLAWENKSWRALIGRFSADSLGHLSFLAFRVRSVVSAALRDFSRYRRFRLYSSPPQGQP